MTPPVARLATIITLSGLAILSGPARAGDIASGGGTHTRLDLVLTDRLGSWVVGRTIGTAPGLVLDAGLLAINSSVTPVAWLSVSAMATPAGVRLDWTVTADSDPAGFAVEREEVDLDRYVQVTSQLLPGSTRQFVDFDPPEGVEVGYRLIAVDRSGRSFTSLPIRVMMDHRPLKFAVGPPMPNPTAQGTTLAVDIGSSGPVRLRVFDVNGRLVAEPIDSVLPAGRHLLSWNGQASGGGMMGGQAAAGVYFLRLEADGRHAVKRVVINR